MKIAQKVGFACGLALKALSEDGEFEGYASTFGNVDNGGDIAVKGCFMASLRARPASAVKMLWQHDRDDIIGQWLEMREDDRGLYAKGRLFISDIQQAREAHFLMKSGVLDGLSIGFQCLKDEWDSVNSVRRLVEVDLREVSLVTFAMNELAAVQSVKAGELPTEREFEAFLQRDAGFSAKQAKMIISSGFKSLKVERDADSRGGSDLEDEVAKVKRMLQNL